MLTKSNLIVLGVFTVFGLGLFIAKMCYSGASLHTAVVAAGMLLFNGYMAYILVRFGKLLDRAIDHALGEDKGAN